MVTWSTVKVMRAVDILMLIFIGATMGCDFHDPCIQVGSNEEFGLDHLEKIRLVSNHAKELGLPTTSHEVAAIVGAAYAASQIEGGQRGVPVRICLRSGNEVDTEYRVFATKGKP